MRNTPEIHLMRSRQAAADMTDILAVSDIQEDFPQTREWHHSLVKVQEQVAAREKYLDWTLVVIAGASGTGKSSLLNSLTHTSSAKVGNIRPTTTEILTFATHPEESKTFQKFVGLPSVTAVGDTSIRPLLDHLLVTEIPDRRLLASSNATQIAMIENLLDSADLMVWVTEPQRYADAEFVADLRRWGNPQNSFVVLTHTDTLSESELAEVKQEFQRVTAAQGIDLPLLTTSIYQETSLAEFRDTIEKASYPPQSCYLGMQSKLQMVSSRICNEAQLLDNLSDADSQHDAKFCEVVVRACGEDLVKNQLCQDYLRSSRPLVTLSPIAWLAGLTSKDKHTDYAPPRAAQLEVKAATQSYATSLGQRFPHIWQCFFQEQAKRHSESLTSALNLAMNSWDAPKVKPQFWWHLWWIMQWLCLIALSAGFLWALIWLVCLLGGVSIPGTLAAVPLAPLAFIAGLVLTLVCFAGGIKISALRAEKFGENGVVKFRQLVNEVCRKAFLEPMQHDLALYSQLRELGREMGGI